MPIYAYRCESCGLAKDVLQKMSDDVLTDCPACGAATFKKQLTAAGFQLKGSGWYATDFKGGTPPAPAADASTPDSKVPDNKAPPDSKPADTPASGSGSQSSGDSAPAKTVSTPPAAAGVTPRGRH
ncbi:MAG: hypothetical protein RLZZ401_1181 [Pseudomonadota bacterium]